jgi:DegV family protein with EDD domain
MIKIITDSTSDIDLKYAEELNVEVVPLKVIIDGKEYKDRIDLQPEEFYDLLVNSQTLPSTSQPSPQDFVDLYETAKNNNDSVIVITLSSVISGTYQSANLAKDLVDYDDIYVIDSLGTTQMQRLLVLKAVALRNEGMNAQDLYTFLEIYKHRIRLFAFVDTLEYLYKGGRLSRTAATAGTLLKFKPIIGFDEGKLDVFAKARGTQKATAKIIDLIQQDGEMDLDEPICIGYTGSSDGLDKFENTLRETLHFGETLHGIVGPVIGTHAGPGARLIAYVKKQ